MKETRKEEQEQEKEKKDMLSNLIIHGVKEVNDDTNSCKKNDEEFISSFLNTLEVNVKHKHCFRIGQPNNGKTRPIKLIMNSEGDTEKITNNLRKLKNADECFKTIQVTDDHTIEERELIKEWVVKARESNEKEGEHSQFVYKIRGSPKNGLRLVKFTKRNQ